MSENPFQVFWSEKYNFITPLGWNLWRDLPKSYVRFHALPESKQYSDNDLEQKIITERAGILFEEVIKRNASFWLATSRPKSSDGKIEDPYTIQKYNLTSQYEWVDLEEDIENQRPWQTYARYFDKLSNNFDDIFLKIADEEDWATLFINEQNGDILAPYPGGFDLIVNDETKRSALISKYKDWLPKKA